MPTYNHKPINQNTMGFLYGTFSVTCDKCGVKLNFDADEVHFERSNSEANSTTGRENRYSWKHSIDCDCGSKIDIDYSVYENPDGTFNRDEIALSGATENKRFGYDFFPESKADFDSDDFN